MKIFHLITGLQVGGAERQLAQLVLGSDRERFHHVVVSMMDSKGRICDELRFAGIDVHSLNMPKSWPSIGAFRQLLRLLDEYRPEVLHCWMYHACLMGAVACRFVGNQRLIWGIRAAHANLANYRFATRMVIRSCAALSHWPERVILNAHSSLKAHRQLGFLSTNMNVVPNGVDEQRFAPDPNLRLEMRRELGIENATALVGMCARFDPMKDHATFLEAAAMVRKRVPGVFFVLFGTRVDARNSHLNRLVDDAGLRSAVLLLGERHDVPRLLSALDVACLSSWAESFPNAVIEAMACGIPCVVTDVGDSASIVAESGIVVPVRDSAKFGEAICALLERSSVERTALGLKARERVLGNFTLARTIAEWETFYRDPDCVLKSEPERELLREQERAYDRVPEA